MWQGRARLARVKREYLLMEWTHQTHLCDLATQIAPEVLMRFPPRKRAWGMPGAQCTRSLVCEVVV